MKLSFTTIILVILILIFSVFVANISNLIAVQVENTILNEDDINKVPSYSTSKARDNKKHSKDVPSKSELMDDSFEHLMWFIQVSF